MTIVEYNTSADIEDFDMEEALRRCARYESLRDVDIVGIEDFIPVPHDFFK